MRCALVCGDGLPVSGLLTVFRSVVEIGLREGLIEPPVPADLGYSWRPDKPWFPAREARAGYPDWLEVTDAVPVHQHREDLSQELTTIRALVARADTLGFEVLNDLRRRVERIAGAYEEHFLDWFGEHDVDWVYAVNLTLSDAAPVTIGLHRAAARRWHGARAGGVLFWDHDLFGSYSVYDGGSRLYPVRPNEFTPLPDTNGSHLWAVVSEGLAEEASNYPTALRPEVVPNVLPTIPAGALTTRHREFLAQHGLGGGQPLVLVPVRVFRVKGVEIAISFLAAVMEASRHRGEPDPCLLVFGSLDEDPPYAREVMAGVERLRLTERVRFLDGVPLQTYRDDAGQWHLDEIDLLRLAAASGAGVVFTPNACDVESIGLGPALAAIARLPCAVTPYDAFTQTYGDGFGYVPVVVGEDLEPAAEAFVDLMAGNRDGDPHVRRMLGANEQIVLERFSPDPWRNLLAAMARRASGVGGEEPSSEMMEARR